MRLNTHDQDRYNRLGSRLHQGPAAAPAKITSEFKANVEGVSVVFRLFSR